MGAYPSEELLAVNGGEERLSPLVSLLVNSSPTHTHGGSPSENQWVTKVTNKQMQKGAWLGGRKKVIRNKCDQNIHHIHV